jgi:hypothetical protein
MRKNGENKHKITKIKRKGGKYHKNDKKWRKEENVIMSWRINKYLLYGN